MSFSIVIPSKNIENLAACVAAIRAARETALVIVIWDGRAAPPELLALPGMVQFIEGAEPFCFARNANIGIAAAATDDVILINDDVLLETPQGFTKLAAAARGAGIVSAAIKGPAHWAHAAGTRWSGSELIVGRMFVPFACVWLNRAMLDAVGALDERFVPGSFEDNDYCWRANNASWSIGTYYGCVVDHEKLPHTFRLAEGKPLYDAMTNRQRFVKKWGFDPGRMNA